MKNSSTTPVTPAEHKVIELRKEGMAIDKMHEATGVPERRIKALIADIPKGKKPPKKVTRIPTPLARATERIFLLARRKQGIRDYELKNILHEEYGTEWDTSTGTYRSKFNSDTITRVKEKVRKRAIEEDCTVIFVMDWIDENAPRMSNNFLMNAATDLQSRIGEYVSEYMTLHGTRIEESSESAQLARRKQYYSVERHLIKLAIKGYDNEPIENLLRRTTIIIGELEGNPDLPLADNGATPEKSGKPKCFREPSGVDHFLDYAERKGWLL